jgi:hypothetical protein
MKNFAYIDESGDTGYTRKSSRYFIVTAVIVDDMHILRRIAKDIHVYKIGKGKTSLLHACKESFVVRKKYVQKLHPLNLRCVVCAIDKHRDRVKDVYQYTLTKLVKYLIQKDVIIIISQRDTRKSYNTKIIETFSQYNLNLSFSNSQKEKSLQIADFYSWSVYAYLEYSNPAYYNALQHQITIL